MFITKRFVDLTLVALLYLSGCSETIAVDAGIDDGQIDAGQDHADFDAVVVPQIDAGQNDAGLDAVVVPQADAIGEASLDANADAPTNGICRVVDWNDDELDVADAGEVDPDVPIVSGVISADGECLAGVEVCLTYMMEWDWPYSTTIADSTNQYGAFELPTDTRFPSDLTGSDFTLTLRKAGFRFDPPSFSLSASDLDSNLNLGGLSTNVTQVATPTHATGQWLVVEAVCPMSENIIELLEDRCSSLFKDESGDILTFRDGCLFGGIGCVDGDRYTDEEAICRGNSGPSTNTFYWTNSEGEYDEETRTWVITRTYNQSNPPANFFTISQRLVLERTP